MEPVKMLKVNEVAKFLQMNRMTIYKLAKSGRLPAVKIGSEWRFEKEKLEEWLRIHSGGRRFPKKTKLRQKAELLVVDDDAGIRDLFEKILKDEGYTVYLASSGKECMELIKKYNPDVVLLDLKMPDIDGIDTLRLIKDYNKKITVIMVTAYATMNTAIQAMKLGAYDYIAKPFDNEKIIETVSAAATRALRSV